MLLVTTKDQPKGRHLRPQSSPVKEWGLRHRCPVKDFPLNNSGEFTEELKKLAPDLLVVISFGVILPEEVIRIPRLATLNVHPSLLPRYRGAAPIQWALMNGDPETGVSIVRMIKKLDAGDILLQKKTPIGPEEDMDSLEKRLSALGCETLLESLALLEAGRVSWTPQEDGKASYARKLQKEDGRIDWHESAFFIRNRIRAMKQWPTSYCFYGGKRIIVLEAEPSDSEDFSKNAPGMILAASQKSGLFVGAGDRPLEIKKLQLEGKKPLTPQEFLKGFSLKEGQLLE